MSPEQALLFLKQVLVLKSGLTLDDCAGAVQAWNILAEELKGKNGRDQESNSQDTPQA